MINKIAHMREQSEKNLNENYKANKDSMKIIFNQEKVRHEQEHYNNDIPLLKTEVNDMKTQLNNLNEQNQLFALQSFKYETEAKMAIEDIKKMNTIIENFSKENNKMAYEIVTLKNKIFELREKVQSQSDKNIKLYNNINNLIAIK